MARPAKPVELATGARTKEEIENRKKYEEQLKGSQDITVPDELSDKQKNIFLNIINMLNDADVLSCLDTYILTRTAVTIDALDVIDEMIRDDSSLFLNATLMSSKAKYTRDFFRCCNELGLSPQSRAKMAISFAKKDEEDELMKIMAGRDNDD